MSPSRCVDTLKVLHLHRYDEQHEEQVYMIETFISIVVNPIHIHVILDPYVWALQYLKRHLDVLA